LVAVGLAAVGMPGASAAEPAACKITAASPFQPGFNNRVNHVSSSGEYRAAVIFVDFPDAPATQTIEQAFGQFWTPEGEQYLTDLSEGRLSFAVVAHQEWVRLSQPLAEFDDDPRDGGTVNQLIEAIELADASFDFTGIDAVWVAYDVAAGRTSAQAFTVPIGSGSVVDGGANEIHNAIVVGTTGFDLGTPELDGTEVFLAHEILHTVGLADLYSLPINPDPFMPFEVRYRFTGNFDRMGIPNGGYQGGSFGGGFFVRNGSEMMAFNRWQLGWIEDTQVRCLGLNESMEVDLTPMSLIGGPKAAMVRLDANRVLVFEARVRDRYDRDMLFDGVLAYIVDSSIFTGQGPITVDLPVTAGWPSSLDLLQPGQSHVTETTRIRVLSGDGSGYRVLVEPYACNGLPITIDLNEGDSGTGTEGDDVILGTNGADVIEGLGGNDTICGGTGDDLVLGGDGDDWIDGQGGSDVLRGNGGSDRLFGDTGSDRLLGGTGDDELVGGGGDDYLGGFGGADLILGGSGADTIFGGFGPDTIDAGPGDDIVNGLVGDDQITGGNGDDILNGDKGRDIIEGSAGNDTLNGGNAADTLRGGEGDDVVNGGKADDSLFGGVGFDVCSGNKHTVADFLATDCERRFGVP
jgi:M6 family metalloprotease-like protein